MHTMAITGANRGLGLEFVRQYAADGGTVHAGCRNPDAAEALRLVAGEVLIHRVDASDPGSVRRFAAAVEGPADVVVANAGVYGGAGNDFGAIDYDAWDVAFAVNVRGVVAAAEAFAPNLKAAKGRFAVVSSKMGSIADASSGVVCYRATKAAANMVTSMIASAFAADGVAAAPFHPGWVRTDMGGPNGLIGAEESVAGLRRRIAEMQVDPSPRFLDYAGEEIPW